MVKVETKPVLVVDDDEGIRGAIAEALEDEGYPVLTARNGLQAIELLRSGPEPCLIFLDMMMPVMDGMGFLEERARDPRLADVPVVVITASGRKNVPGAARTLTKPIVLDQLLETIAGYCGQA